MRTNSEAHTAISVDRNNLLQASFSLLSRRASEARLPFLLIHLSHILLQARATILVRRDNLSSALFSLLLRRASGARLSFSLIRLSYKRTRVHIVTTSFNRLASHHLKRI